MKKIFKPTIITIGLIIGSCSFSLILFLVNKLRTNDGIDKVDVYIANCQIIPLTVGNFTVIKGNVTGLFTRTGANSYYAEEAVFYEPAYKKYFSLKYLGNMQNEIVFDDYVTYVLQKGDSIKATVNKIELADTSYGTQKKTVPVFWFTGNGDTTKE